MFITSINMLNEMTCQKIIFKNIKILHLCVTITLFNIIYLNDLDEDNFSLSKNNKRE